MLHCNLTQAEFRDTSLDGADLRWSCIDSICVEDDVLARANTKNAGFSECAWIEEATPEKEQSLEIGGM